MKDKAILLGWIAGLLILISVLWIFAQSALAFNLMRTVNNVFINNDDSRRIYEFVKIKAEKAETLGYWYKMYDSTNKMFVFTAFQDGILIPLGAIVSSNGIVGEILPLSAHAVQIFDTMPKSVLQMYVNRIEDAARINFEVRQGAGR